jgi:hypothetical protein
VAGKTDPVVVECLQSWRSMLKHVGRMTEEQLQQALDIERRGLRRKMLMARLASRLRTHRLRRLRDEQLNSL